MRELYTSMDSTRIGFYKSVLDEAGIPCFIQNETTSQLVNMLAMVFQPTLCIINDEQYEQALALLKPHHEVGSIMTAEEWLCPCCKESNPASFDLCWNCQAAKPE